MAQQLHQRAADSLFEQLYRAHVDDVYRYSLAITRNAADTEDVVQTTFMNAYRALERGESPIDARRWLIVIARNVCRQRYRQAASRPSEVLLREELVDGVMRDEDAPTAAEIQHALSRLVPSQREALVMRELEGRSYSEIAKRLGLTISAVESALFRARRALEPALVRGRPEAASRLESARRRTARAVLARLAARRRLRCAEGGRRDRSGCRRRRQHVRARAPSELDDPATRPGSAPAAHAAGHRASARRSRSGRAGEGASRGAPSPRRGTTAPAGAATAYRAGRRVLADEARAAARPSGDTSHASRAGGAKPRRAESEPADEGEGR